jgi:hypothetical protein
MRLCDIDWGKDSAESDPTLLEYFVKSQAFTRISNKSKNIVVGRKGSGKSALRKKLGEVFQSAGTHVVTLSPQFNTIRSILNDRDLREEVFGQEIFFQHIWLRQILLACLCDLGDSAKGSLATKSMEFARQVAKEKAKTSKDILESITDVLSKIKAKAGTLGEFGLTVEKELRAIADVDALEFHLKALAEGNCKLAVFIDDLDLGWDNSKTANNLLLGLLYAVTYITSLSPNLFVCVFLREDVYSLLLNKTQHSDKYRDIERIRWGKTELLKVLSERIKFNRKKNNLPEVIDLFGTVFELSMGASNTDNWLIERTLSRPRELIQFSRIYTESVDDDQPNSQKLKAAEQAYSSWKLDDLCTEYGNQYPGLATVFTYWKQNFARKKYHMERAEIDDIVLEIASKVTLNEPWFNQIVNASDMHNFLTILFEIGFLGDFIKGGAGGSKTIYSYEENHVPKFEEIQIHPCFRRAVDTVERIRASSNQNLVSEDTEQPISNDQVS